MRFGLFLSSWVMPVLMICLGIGLLVAFSQSDILLFVSYVLLVLGVSLLLFWAWEEGKRKSSAQNFVPSSSSIRSEAESIVALRDELSSRIREVAEFKAELEMKRAQIDALKAGINRTEDAELNESIAQLYISLEFERGRADGEFAQILSGLSEPVDALLSAAGLVKGVPAPGQRFIDQPAGSCKVFKTELTSDAALKGTIKAVRSPWVGFMANGKLKVITASNVSVFA